MMKVFSHAKSIKFSLKSLNNLSRSQQDMKLLTVSISICIFMSNKLQKNHKKKTLQEARNSNFCIFFHFICMPFVSVPCCILSMSIDLENKHVKAAQKCTMKSLSLEIYYSCSGSRCWFYFCGAKSFDFYLQ